MQNRETTVFDRQRTELVASSVAAADVELHHEKSAGEYNHCKRQHPERDRPCPRTKRVHLNSIQVQRLQNVAPNAVRFVYVVRHVLCKTLTGSYTFASHKVCRSSKKWG